MVNFMINKIGLTKTIDINGSSKVGYYVGIPI
jgi:hypothetical protein